MNILLQASVPLGEEELRLILLFTGFFLVHPVLVLLALRRVLKRHQLGLLETQGAVLWIFLFFLCPFLGSLGYLLVTRRLPVR